MKKKTNRLDVLACMAGLGLLASTAFASQEAALGANGELYMVRTGTYGELMPGQQGADPANTALALDVLRPESAAQRLVVPGTDGPEVETSPSLLYEEDSHTVFLVWASRINSIHSVFQLISFDGSHWSTPIRIIGNPFSGKTPPQLAVTRDAFRDLDAGGQPVTKHRTIVHLVWDEEGGAGQQETLYSPIILENGTYLGWNPIYSLNSFTDADGATPATSFETSPALIGAPTVQGGRDKRTVVTGFASAVTRRLSTVEIDVLPEELVRLADGTRAQIIDLGAHLTVGPSTLPGFADQVRAKVIELGTEFQPEVAQAIADRVRAIVAAGGNPGLASIAEHARAQIIDLGAKLSGRGLRPSFSGDTAATTIEVEKNSAAPQPTQGTHLIQFRIASSRPAPRVGAGPITLYLSESGQDVLIAWPADPTRLLYRDSNGDGWNDIRELKLTDSLDFTRAYDILRERARMR
jgi:hypothetical protein